MLNVQLNEIEKGKIRKIIRTENLNEKITKKKKRRQQNYPSVDPDET